MNFPTLATRLRSAIGPIVTALLGEGGIVRKRVTPNGIRVKCTFCWRLRLMTGSDSCVDRSGDTIDHFEQFERLKRLLHDLFDADLVGAAL